MNGISIKRLVFTVSMVLALLIGFTGQPVAAATNDDVYLPMVVSSNSFVNTSAACTNCYYVDSVAGNDSNTGSDSTHPWKSLSKVNSFAFTAGSTVNFKRGSSWTGSLLITRSGASGSPITYQPYGTGASPVIKNTPNMTVLRSRVIDVQANWIVIKGFYLADAYEAGVYLLKGKDHNVVAENEITNVGIGININSSYNLVTKNFMHDLHMVVNTPGGTDDYGAIGVGIYNSNNEISYNKMINCLAPSYDFVTDGGAVEWYGVADNVYVHHNLAINDNGFLEIGGGSAKNARISYNVSINNGTFSYVHMTGTFASVVTNMKIENNSIYENLSGKTRGWVIFGWRGTPTPSIAVLRNNIVYANNFTYVSKEVGFGHDHNLYYLPNGTKLNFTLGTGEKNADPLYKNPAGNDISLKSGSPAINMGVLTGITTDFINSKVPTGTGQDAGAYEYQTP